jgi:hypothetical protein
MQKTVPMAAQRPPRRGRSSKNRARALGIAGFAPDYYYTARSGSGNEPDNAAFTCDFQEHSAVPADKPLGIDP